MEGIGEHLTALIDSSSEPLLTLLPTERQNFATQRCLPSICISPDDAHEGRLGQSLGRGPGREQFVGGVSVPVRSRQRVHAVYDEGRDMQHIQDHQAGTEERCRPDDGKFGLDDGSREQVHDGNGCVVLGPDLDTTLKARNYPKDNRKKMIIRNFVLTIGTAMWSCAYEYRILTRIPEASRALTCGNCNSDGLWIWQRLHYFILDICRPGNHEIVDTTTSCHMHADRRIVAVQYVCTWLTVGDSWVCREALQRIHLSLGRPIFAL